MQQSLCLDEVIDDSSSAHVEFPKGVDSQNQRHAGMLCGHLWKAAGARARGDPVHERKHQLGKYEDTTSSLLKRNTSSEILIDNEGFDLVDLRKAKPKNFVTGRWVLTIKTDKQGNFFKAKARWVLRGFQDKQKDHLQTDSPASTRPGFRDELPNGSQQ